MLSVVLIVVGRGQMLHFSLPPPPSVHGLCGGPPVDAGLGFQYSHPGHQVSGVCLGVRGRGSAFLGLLAVSELPGPCGHDSTEGWGT